MIFLTKFEVFQINKYKINWKWWDHLKNYLWYHNMRVVPLLEQIKVLMESYVTLNKI